MDLSVSDKIPKLIVFDLDYTLWSFWVDTHVSPPFSEKNGKVVDGTGKKISCYDEVPQVLKSLSEQGYTLAVASRTEYPEGGRKLMKLFGINKYFKYKEIYPGNKVSHFKVFHEKSGIPYKEMMFFDDEHRNIRDITALGAFCQLVKNGVTQELVDKSLQQFSRI